MTRLYENQLLDDRRRLTDDDPPNRSQVSACAHKVLILRERFLAASMGAVEIDEYYSRP
ncbi:MAG: hypothetical protein RKO25_01925 [Candidatus Contendobacter sp.]|nr:hypothetical protein [Candidatus Contendobacter sp.]